MKTSEIIDVVIKMGVYFAIIVASFVGIRSAVLSLRKDHEDFVRRTEKTNEEMTSQVRVIDGKVDGIVDTLTVIQANAARHDQRAQDIQQHVAQIGERVTYLERNT